MKTSGSRLLKKVSVTFAMLCVVALYTSTAKADGNRKIASLKTVAVPRPARIGDYVKDRAAAIVLGKALFWEMQTGSDGVTACATCHFHAGTDDRSKNQLNPGSGGVFDFGGPNYQFQATDFPFHKLANRNDRLSSVLFDTTNVSGSQGLNRATFDGVGGADAVDLQTYVLDDAYKVSGDSGFLNVRRTTGRNTPSVINAVFNFRNFWDGRAQNEFNGVNPFGSRDANARVVLADSSGHLQAVQIRLENSALASQSVGPPNNGVEMAAAGRSFPRLGRKLLGLLPLAKQLVDKQDSVLGGRSLDPAPGISGTYADLIRSTFQPVWWSSNQFVCADDAGSFKGLSPDQTCPAGSSAYTQMEYNFSLFWGLAIQSYESTLVSDDTPFDRFASGNSSALTSLQKQGMSIYTGKGKCADCHSGAELTDAAVSNVNLHKIMRFIPVGSLIAGLEDVGFHNGDVRPDTNDVGIAGTDPVSGNSLSFAKLAESGLFTDPKLSPPVAPGEKAVIKGAVKTPGLRNIELTAPYFHNGGNLTLLQVIDFYSRGGDFINAASDDRVKNLGLKAADKQALAAFLQALTDERVRHESAPFDHPQLFVPVGSPSPYTADVTGANATTTMMEIKATGASGDTPKANFTPE